MVKLSQFVRSDLAFDVPKASSQREVFGLVAARLAEKGIIPDAAALAEELTKREQQGSTGVGNGMALPHAILADAKQIAVVVVRLGTALDWDAIDHEPVKLLVVIVAPTGQRDDYLPVLAEVARSLNQPDVRDAALRAKDVAHAVRAIVHPPHESFFMRNRRLIVFIGVVVLTFIAARQVLPGIRLPDEGIYAGPDYARFNEPRWLFHQEITITLFLATMVGTLLFWRYRLAIAAASLGALLIAGVLDLETTVRFMSIPTILFIMSMMVIVHWLRNIGVFRFVVAKAIERVRGIPWLLLLTLMAFSVLLGGFADEVSAILVTFGLAQEVAKRAKTPLVPYLLSLVFATNVGSALTLVGNPIGVYIAFAGKLSFEHFLRWATPVSAVAAVVTAGICLIAYRRYFFGRRVELDAQNLERAEESIDPARLRIGIITFLVVVFLVAIHRRVELLLHLGDGTALVAEALLVVGFIVFYEQEKGRLLVERGIDWWTLLFFMFLFANAACLEYTGVTTKLGYVILTASRQLAGAGASPAGVTSVATVIVLWFSGISSGFVDNLPIVAALVPVVKDMIRTGLPHATILWWALLFGGCFGGNLTVIGSTANLVAIGAYERVSGKSIRFRDWIKFGAIITGASLLAATASLLLQLGRAP
jgi:Na+/H+ antiporter NhaD/arsenite permease-like protein/mannitol/fructose-specific phosphotransferase system IIA component (Ntr-type)